MLAATRHDRFFEADFRRLAAHGLYTVRSGLRWHLIERPAGRYDVATFLPMLRAARQHGLQMIWDLCHYGWPDDIDVYRPAFVRRFAALAAAFARVVAQESDETLFVCPINEPSFFSWAGGEALHLNPYERGRSFELKAQLIRAAIEATEAIWNVLPTARIVTVDPLVRVVPNPALPRLRDEALGYHNAQYQSWDMLCGRIWPQLGGEDKYLDIIGVNYYPYNQWFYEGLALEPTHPAYMPFHMLVKAIYERYRRPMLIAETGTEDDARAAWLNYMCEQAREAIRQGVPLHGLCLYPIFNHPGWLDERHCHNGLWDYADEHGQRAIYQPLADEVARQQQLMGQTISLHT